MTPIIRSGPSIVTGKITAGAEKSCNAFDVDALVTSTGGSTAGEANCPGPASDVGILPLDEAEVAARA